MSCLFVCFISVTAMKDQTRYTCLHSGFVSALDLVLLVHQVGGVLALGPMIPPFKYAKPAHLEGSLC